MTLNPTAPEPLSIPSKSSIFRSKIIYGYILALGAHCCIAISQFFMKRVRTHLPAFQTLQLVFLQLAVYNYIILRYKGASTVFPKAKLNRITIIRGCLGVTGASGLLYSLGKLLLSEVIIINNTSPLMTSIFAIFFLKERFDTALGINAVLSVIGVLLIAKPAFLFATNSTEEQPKSEVLGFIAAGISALMGGIVPLVLKHAGSLTHPNTLVFFHGFITCIVSPFFISNEGVKTATGTDVIMIFIAGTVWTMGQILVTVSFLYADASRLGMVLYSQVIFAYAIEILVDGIYPDNYAVMGTFCILSGFLVMLRKAFEQARARKESEILSIKQEK